MMMESCKVVQSKPRFTDIRSIQTQHYYGHFALFLGKKSPYIYPNINPLNTDTRLIRTFSMGRSVSVLTGIYCTKL